MSARQPFQPSKSMQKNDQNIPPPVSKSAQDIEASQHQPLAAFKKPLNMSGLKRRKDPANNSQRASDGPASDARADKLKEQPRRSFEGIQRPLLPAPAQSLRSRPASTHSQLLAGNQTQDQMLKIVAPHPSSPFFPSSVSGPDAVPMSAFRSSASYSQQQLGNPLTGSPTVSSSQMYNYNASSPSDPLTSMPMNQDPHTQMHGAETHDHAHTDTTFANHRDSMLQHTGKRSERPDEHDSFDDTEGYAYGYGEPAKRYRSEGVAGAEYQQSEGGYGRMSRHATPAPRMSATPAPRMSATPAPYQNAPFGYKQPGNAFADVLGRDLDTYIEANVHKHEAATNRWRESSMEEWVDGADELTQKFGKILDFVKDAMTDKMKLHATLFKRLADHKEVLATRDAELKSAQKDVVDEAKILRGPKSAV
ncbi:hypothetical protein PLICRDRAFT_173713 [Plicaturopsis crispa FD-325 SS-3]|nr:hypothetical protein PLICRDRAFT_173713 [Plicaturopsis crispa FD-325 SS-3]